MSAIVRVKRRIDDDPLSALILNCKKPRMENGAQENIVENKLEISTVLKFAGTVEKQDENIANQITRFTKDQAKQLAQKLRKPNIIGRLRNELKEHSHENRFKIVNLQRTFAQEEGDAPKEITIVDIEEHSANSEQKNDVAKSAVNAENVKEAQIDEGLTEQKEETYVYDLYLPEDDQQVPNVSYVDTYLSVHTYEDRIFEDTYNDEEESFDSEDSNEENYWKNEYPDTESFSSVDETDMIDAVNGLRLEDNEDLSSDYFEDEDDDHRNFINILRADNPRFESDLDYHDIKEYYDHDSNDYSN